MATKKLDYEHDKAGFIEAQKQSVILFAEGKKKIALLKQCEEIYLMRRSQEKSKEVKWTVSPDGKNKLKGARRLLSASVPHFRVPREKNDPKVEEVSSKLEQIAGVMWSMSNHIQGVRLESETALSGLLYDEMIIDIVCMQDVVDDVQMAYKAEGDKWEKARWEGRLDRAKKQAAMTPYLFEAVSPMIYYPQYGRGGTSSVLSEVKRTVGEVKTHWGARALKAIGTRKDTEYVTERTMIDNTFKYVWLKENPSEPIFAEPHGLPMMQTIAVRCAGSNLFSEVTDQYDPFLKTMAESGLNDMQNRILTALNTNLSATLNTQWDFTQGAPEDTITIDHSQLLGVVSHPPNSSLKPFIKDVLSRDVVGALELVRGMNSESTIYDQALGAREGHNDPYGLVSLLSQAGRLPLTDVQTMMGELAAKVMEVAFAWWKKQGGKGKVQAAYGKELTITPAEIPATIRFEVDVDIELPQDKLQLANTGSKFKDMGASDEWVLSNFAGIENPDQMAKQAWFEMARKAAGAKKIEEIIMKLMTPPPPPVQEAPQTPPPAPAGSVPTPPPQMGAGMPPAPQTPRGMPTEADMNGQVPPMPPEMGGL